MPLLSPKLSRQFATGLLWLLLSKKKWSGQEKLEEKTEPEKIEPARPIATPARSKHELPGFVVDSLQEKTSVVPFATGGGEEDLLTGGPGEDAAAADAPKKVPAKKKGKSKKKKSKAAAKQTFCPEEEAALEPAAPKDAGDKSAAEVKQFLEEGMEHYAPGKFQELYLNFVKQEKANGLKHRAAVEKWMLSATRAKALSDVSVGQMKKRRFM